VLVLLLCACLQFGVGSEANFTIAVGGKDRGCTSQSQPWNVSDDDGCCSCDAGAGASDGDGDGDGDDDGD
jgi:hypothetical protein